MGDKYCKICIISSNFYYKTFKQAISLQLWFTFKAMEHHNQDEDDKKEMKKRKEGFTIEIRKSKQEKTLAANRKRLLNRLLNEENEISEFN